MHSKDDRRPKMSENLYKAPILVTSPGKIRKT